jgi:hypothetical protein
MEKMWGKFDHDSSVVVININYGDLNKKNVFEIN